jgi:hypothetical protein
MPNKPSDNPLFHSDDPALNAKLDESATMVNNAQVSVNAIEAIRDNFKKAEELQAQYAKIKAELGAYFTAKK